MKKYLLKIIVDTSESCNFISPSATREDFTAGIAERVRRIQTTQPLTPKLILNQPLNQRTLSTSTTTNTTTTTAYFDINSGKISTIVSRPPETNGYFNGNTEKFLNSKTIDLQSPTVVVNASKKPSYLNLACCVNGYSNYTNYDSVERKEINKSREASPIRPIITMSRQPRSNDNLLSVPTPVTFVKQSPLTSITKRFASLNIGSTISENDKDTTDDAGVNGSVSSRKSFIQQRVEKLYGTTKILTTTTVKNSETIQINGNGHHYTNGSTTTTNGNHVDEKENDEELFMHSLPVMKHLRPEFCRQLQFLSSPKKVARVGSANNSQIQITTVASPSNEIKKSPEEKKSSETNQNIKVIDQNLRPETKESVVMEHIIKDDVVVTAAESQETSIDLSNNNNNVCVNNKMEIETILSPQTEVRDGHYFLKLLSVEKSRILKLADDFEKELEHLQSDVSFLLDLLKNIYWIF
jgi:hypothetical protein